MTHIEREQCLVASLLEDPHWKWGPNVSTALTHWERWESVESKPIAKIILELGVKGKAASRSMVQPHLNDDEWNWMKYPIFTACNSLPSSCLESLVEPLLPLYRDKQIREVIGDAYQQLIDKPEVAVEVARRLREELEACV